MEKVIEVLNRMQADGVIEKYAIGGGIATIRYIHPYETDDIDVFIPPIISGQNGLVTLEPIYAYLKQLGYEPVKEGVVVEGWLVQFVPTSNALQEEAVEQSQAVMFGKEETRIFSPELLAAELLRSGRPQDYARVITFVQHRVLKISVFRNVLKRHGLEEKWKQFLERFQLEEYE
jgi:hypothetical protein